jgi:hypothetical protein
MKGTVATSNRIRAVSWSVVAGTVLLACSHEDQVDQSLDESVIQGALQQHRASEHGADQGVRDEVEVGAKPAALDARLKESSNTRTSGPGGRARQAKRGLLRPQSSGLPAGASVCSVFVAASSVMRGNES